VVAAGIALVVVARWAARRRGTKWESWVALRIGDLLFTEVAGAFLIGFGLGGLVAPQFEGAGGPVSRIGPPGRFGPLDPSRLPSMLGIVAAAVVVLMRVDVRDILFRGSPPNALSAYVGWETRVIAPIPAGGYGEIAVRDGSGNVMSARATADMDIATGTLVRVTGTKDLKLVVAPISSS
jgi:membrane-bound ClpP family serine protease